MQILERPFTLALAKAFLESCPLVGVVERFDESLVVFGETLQRYFENLDLSYRAQNVSSQPQTSAQDRIRQILDSMGSQKDVFLDENQKDQRIYDFANALLDKRIQTIPDFESKLTELRDHNAKLHRKFFA